MQKFDDFDLVTILRDMREMSSHLFQWGLIDTTGGSFSVRLEDNCFALTPSHSGFKHWKLEEGLLVLNENCERLPESSSNLFAHPSAIIHAEIYKNFPLANAIIHAHAPYTLTYASMKKTVKPFTLQSQILGELPCFESPILTDNKNTIDEIEVKLNQSGLKGYRYAYRHFEPLIDKIKNDFICRTDELKRHGIGFTVYKHGIFVVARNLFEAFDNLIRFERNAQVQILSNQIGEEKAE